MFSTRIVFDRRKVAAEDKNQEGTLEVRVTVERKSYYINTGLKKFESVDDYTGDFVNNGIYKLNNLVQMPEIMVKICWY